MAFNDAVSRSTLDKALADPPARVQKSLAELRAYLRARVPARKVDENLLVGTWNIRAFGGLNDRWHAGPSASPRRDLESLRCIAEIVSHFDVVAIQEVKSDLKALRHMMKILGPDWGFILTETNRGRAGNDERMAFVFDVRRVKPSGLAGELSLPQQVADSTAEFARHPYAVSFRCGTDTLVLVALHVQFGQPKDRLPELIGIAEWMRDWAKTESDWGQNLVVLGDMNIDRKDDPLYEAFVSTGLSPPPELDNVPRTIFSRRKKGFYDQIAWFHEQDEQKSADHRPYLSLVYSGRAGYVDWPDHVLQSWDLSRQDLSWRISDHYPLWVEFRTGATTVPAEPVHAG